MRLDVTIWTPGFLHFPATSSPRPNPLGFAPTRPPKIHKRYTFNVAAGKLPTSPHRKHLRVDLAAILATPVPVKVLNTALPVHVLDTSGPDAVAEQTLKLAEASRIWAQRAFWLSFIVGIIVLLDYLLTRDPERAFRRGSASRPRRSP